MRVPKLECYQAVAVQMFKYLREIQAQTLTYHLVYRALERVTHKTGNVSRSRQLFFTP
jgi:phosphate uptake regulator